MDESESFELEIEVSQSEELNEQARVVESELIEVYLSEKLSESDRKLFEQNYLITQARFERVKLAKQFLNQFKAQRVISVKKSFWYQLFDFQKFPRLAFAVITAFLLFAGLVFVLLNRQNKIEVAQQQNKNQTRSISLGNGNETQHNQSVTEKPKIETESDVDFSSDNSVR
mgnify:CR=1 FL=1